MAEAWQARSYLLAPGLVIRAARMARDFCSTHLGENVEPGDAKCLMQFACFFFVSRSSSSA
jgi:hypothetical protein